MARPINCDICEGGQAAQLLMTQIQSGDTIAVCPACAPLYLTMLRNSICDALYGDHPSETPIEDLLSRPAVEPEPKQAEAGPWPHTEHVIHPGQRKRKGQRETVAEFQAAEADEHLSDA